MDPFMNHPIYRMNFVFEEDAIKECKVCPKSDHVAIWPSQMCPNSNCNGWPTIPSSICLLQATVTSLGLLEMSQKKYSMMEWHSCHGEDEKTNCCLKSFDTCRVISCCSSTTSFLSRLKYATHLSCYKSPFVFNDGKMSSSLDST